MRARKTQSWWPLSIPPACSPERASQSHHHLPPCTVLGPGPTLLKAWLPGSPSPLPTTLWLGPEHTHTPSTSGPPLQLSSAGKAFLLPSPSSSLIPFGSQQRCPAPRCLSEPRPPSLDCALPQTRSSTPIPSTPGLPGPSQLLINTLVTSTPLTGKGRGEGRSRVRAPASAPPLSSLGLLLSRPG